jgi:hypothetical protein
MSKKLEIRFVDNNGNSKEIIAKNIKNTPFELEGFYVEGRSNTISLQGDYYPLMSKTFLKSDVVNSNLVLLEDNTQLKWNNACEPHIGGSILGNIKSGLKSVKAKLSTVGKKAKQGATFVASHAKTKLQVGENDCGNKLLGPDGLKVNYLANEANTNNHYFAVLMYCTVNFRTHVRFLGIMKIPLNLGYTFTDGGVSTVNDVIDKIKLYFTNEEAYVAKITSIAKNKCWNLEKTEKSIEKAKAFLGKLKSLWETSKKTKESFLNILLNRKQEGGSGYILLKNTKGSLLQRHPDENECISKSNKNLANQIWYKLYLNIFTSGECGGQCPDDEDKRKGLKRKCGAVSRKMEISEILPKIHGDVIYQVNRDVSLQSGGTDPTVGATILFVVLVMLCCGSACRDSGVGGNWVFQHICCGMCFDLVRTLFD